LTQIIPIKFDTDWAIQINNQKTNFYTATHHVVSESEMQNDGN